MKNIWDKINCRKCGLCNRKGKPSVMKGSAMCQERQGLLPNQHIRYASHSENFLVKLFGWIRGKNQRR